MNNKILIMAGGGVKHISPFIDEADKKGIDLTVCPFSKMKYLTDGKSKFKLCLDNGEDILSFDVVYIRLVGKRYEDVSLLVSYAKDNGIKIVDRFYEESKYTRLPIAKALEVKLFADNNIPIPKTMFGKLDMIRDEAPEIFGFPFVIKGTLGKQGNAVWSPKDTKELAVLIEKLKLKEKEGSRFIAQEFIKASQRTRVLVVGGKALAAITRPTRWRRRFIKKVNGKFPEGIRKALDPVPTDDSRLAVSVCRALSVDIGGVDIVRDDEKKTPYVFEVNTAPIWKAVKKDTNINVESEILDFLTKLK